MLVGIVTLPFTTSPLPTRVSLTYTLTVPFCTGSPVLVSVTLTSTVTFPAVLLMILASVVLSRGSTFIGTVVFVAL